MDYFEAGSPNTVIDDVQAEALLEQMLSALGPLKRVLLIPPDMTRGHSGAGAITVTLYKRLSEHAEVVVLPALGTHAPMTKEELDRMFPRIPQQAFRVHDWRRDLVRLGQVPASVVAEITDGRLNFTIDCEVNRLLLEGNWDRIISIGQLVPHEVAGIANHSKNIFVGAGGSDSINKTHFIGAVCGMEAAMGRAQTPVRAVFDYMLENFAADLPVSYILTVRATDEAGRLVTRGLFGGDDDTCFLRGAALCQQVNLDLLDRPINKAVVFLDPSEFRSTWLGNKAIYRTRMALADDAELIVFAPGIESFGEDEEIDRLIRRYGYRGTPHTLQMVEESDTLSSNLSAAAHMIHGSSEGRFSITYCPGRLSREEVESVGYTFSDPEKLAGQYDLSKLRDGWNVVRGEELFFVSNPALGLWALKSQFDSED